MTRQTKAWQRVSTAAGATLALAGAGAALGSVERVAGVLAHLLVSFACLGLEVLTSGIVAAWHTLTLCALAPQPAVEGLFRVLVSSCPVILALAGAA